MRIWLDRWWYRFKRWVWIYIGWDIDGKFNGT